MKSRNLTQMVSLIGILTMLFIAVNLAHAAEPAPLKIGCAIPMTGAMATWGLFYKITYPRVVDLVNKGGGIKSMGGAKLELFLSDCESDAKKTVTEVEKIIALRKPHAMLCPAASGLTKAALPIVQRNKLPMACMCYSDELFKEKDSFLFGVMPKVSTNAKAMADFLIKTGKQTGRQIKKVAVLCQDGSFGEMASDYWGKYLPTQGAEVVANEIYPTGKVADFSDTIAKFKALNADALLCSTPPSDSALIVLAMKATDFNPMAYAFSCACIDTPDFINLGKDGDFAYGVPIFPAMADIGDTIKGAVPYLREFYSGLDEKDRRMVNENVVLYASLTIGVIINAFEKAKSYDPMVIRDAMAKLDLKTGDRFIYRPDGVKFDETGHNSRARTIGGQYQNMKLKLLFPESMNPGNKPVFPVPKWTERKM